MSDETLPQTLEEAEAIEEAIREEAAQIRGAAAAEEDQAVASFRMTPALFLSLLPLLRRPIPEAYIRTIPPVPGKPYASTGISSVQVQIDRMDNVLTPLGWWTEEEHHDGGKLCRVTVYVGDASSANRRILPPRSPNEDREPARAAVYLLARSSWGGVGQGSSLGNVYKGSFTNAAKLALARVGPGHEVYRGSTDLDPDVSREIAEEGGGRKTTPSETITAARAKKLAKIAYDAVDSKRLRLSATNIAGTDPGDCSTQAKATAALRTLTPDQADRLEGWLSAELDKQSK